jgi:isoquinoline 1-oxidoreductase beta subunit
VQDAHETPEAQATPSAPVPGTLSRRRLLIATAVTGAAGASLVIGFTLYARRETLPPARPFSPNAWLRVDPDNTVTVTVGRSELGQGVLTALAMAAAEELDADWSRVRALQAPAGSQYGNQHTTGSGSVAYAFATMRAAGVQARARLVAAAAHVWGVDAATCRTHLGTVVHDPSGRHLTYGQLAGGAGSIVPPLSLYHLKQPSQFRLIGTRAPRLDTPAKVDGSARYGLDLRLPDLLFATVARCPVPGGTLVRFDATRARAIPGVRLVTQIPSGVAVVGDHTWAAIAGRRALDVTWDEGANATLASDAIRQQLAAQAPPVSAPQGAARVVTAAYETPYQAHTPMEPLNCTVRLGNNACEVWVGTQDPIAAQEAAAEASGLPFSRVSVQVPFIGGGFGRRVNSDIVTEAVQVARAAGRPVQVMQTREDDLQNGAYRPAAYHRLLASLDSKGKPLSWDHGVAAQSMGSGSASGAEPPYAIPTVHVTGANPGFGVPVTIWRGAELSYNTFAVESFVDELAVAAGADPYQYRRGLLGGTPRLQAALDLAASKAGWAGAPLPAGRGRGIAACAYTDAGTYAAEVAEVTVASDGSVRVDRVVCAVDCGLVVNPAIAESQVEGAIVQGLSATLKSEITFAAGRVQQHNFDDYPLLRLSEMPTIEVYFVLSTEDPSGLGEPALPPLAPAVANAIFAATGKRLRRLPIHAADLR